MNEDAVRDEIRTKLQHGLQTEAYPRAETHEQVQDIIRRLRTSDGTLKSKLVIGGFTLETIEHEGIEQSAAIASATNWQTATGLFSSRFH
jgi:hypothetical protein